MDRDILTKSLIGRLNDLETRELKEWLEASEEHRTYYRKLQGLAMQKQKEPVDVERNYQEFLQKIHRQPRTRSIRMRGWWAAAAVAVCLCGVAWSLLHREAPAVVEDIPLVVATEGTDALLQVEGRKAFLINENTDEQLLQQSGTALGEEANTINYIAPQDSVPVQPKTHLLKIPHSGEFHLELADGTNVWLNAETELEYLVPFAAGERRVKLNGEAYFEVAKSDVPFVVAFKGMEIQVLGTKFNVQAYEDSERFAATLVEGSIALETGAEALKLQPGEQVRKEGEHLVVETVDVTNCIAWKDGVIAFEGERLEDIMEKLGRWYDIEVFYQNPEVKDMRFTGNIDRYEDVRMLLGKIEKMNVVSFTVKGNCITVCKNK